MTVAPNFVTVDIEFKFDFGSVARVAFAVGMRLDFVGKNLAVR